MRTFLSLDHGAKMLLIEAFLLRVSIGAGFRLLGVIRTQALLRRWAGRNMPPMRPDPQSAVRAARSAQRLVRRTLGFGESCLVRSLGLWAMLLRRGLHTELRVGFRCQPEGLSGHAWLEYDGVAINEEESVTRTYCVHEGPVSFDQRRAGGRKRIR